MSTTVDERVVEMRFDNDQFESNVNESISTLGKLKQNLKLTGASKGLEAVNAASKKINFTPIVSGMDQITTKFSHAQMTIQHQIDRWADRIVSSAERAVKALTIDPVKSGFQEYETQINSVQTILANTSSKGSTIEDVNKALEELNKYADKTIYNFTEMTRNIGTFTAAGVDLDTSVNAIQGIANLAAVSGSTSQQASTAMYQLSQALASGTVKLMDWNSVVNAGMGGEVFQNALKETARAHGIAIDQMIAEQGSFRETLKDGWITSEILTETLQKFTLTTEGLTDEQIEANKQMLRAKGYTEEQIKEIFELGRTATDAATKVKTFTQLWDVLKESAQSGWSQSWKIIIGDFEQAKAFLTPLADFLTSALTKMSDFRNAILDKALNNPFANTLKSIYEVGDGLKAAVNSLSDYEKVVNEIIGGKWGNGQERWEKLTQAGYDWAHAQNLVNEKLGSGVRHATDYTEAQEGVAKVHRMAIEDLVDYNDAVLRVFGYTEEQIAALRFLEKQAEKTGIPIEDLAKDMDLLSGRSLLLNSFKNIGKSLVDVFTEVRWAWRDIFYGEGTTDEEIIDKKALQIYDLIAAFHKFTTYLEVDSDRADKLRRTFKGLFAIIDVITTLVGGGFKIAFKLIKSVLGYFNMDILDLTANVGDALVKFRDWVDSVLDFDGIISRVIPMLVTGAKAVKGWIDAFTDLPFVQSIISNIRDGFLSLKDLDFKEICKNIIAGLTNGLGDGIITVVQKMKDIGTQLLNAIREVLGIQSPSVEMYNIGLFIIQGLIDGIAFGIKWVIQGVRNVGSAIINFFKSLDFSGITGSLEPAINKFKALIDKIDFKKLLAIIPIFVALKMVKTLFGIVKAVTDGINSFNDLIESFAGIGKKIEDVLGAVKWRIVADTVKQLAIALAIVVGSVLALTFVDSKKLLPAVGTIVLLMAALAGLAFAVSKMSDSSAKFEKGKLEIDGLKASLLSIGAAVLLLAATAKMLGGMTVEQYTQGMLGVMAIMGLMIAFMWLCGKVGSDKSAEAASSLGSMLLKLSASLLLLILVCKLVAKLRPEEMMAGALFASGFLIFVSVLAFVTQSAGEHVNKLGGMLLKISIAMILMIGVCKLAAKLSEDEMKAGAAFALGFLGFVALLMAVNKIGKGDEISKVGRLLLSISISILLMIAVCKLVAKLSLPEIVGGIAAMIIFCAFVAVLTKVTTITNEQKTAKLAGTILAIAGAIAILAVVAILLGMVPVDMLAKGVVAILLLGGVMTAMIWACRGANNITGTLFAMVAAIAVMAIAVGALSAIEWTKLAAATASIGALMLIFKSLITVAKTAAGAIGPLIVITVAVGVLAGAIYLVGQLPVENALGAAASLSILLLSLVAALKIIDSIRKVSVSAMVAMGVLTLIMGALGAILYLLRDLPVESTLANAKSLSLLILSLSGACILLGVVGLFGPAVTAGLLALGQLVTGILAFIVIFATLNTYIPDLETFLDKGIAVLEKIGYALGSFFGNIIAGFGEAVMSMLPTLGSSLSAFMINAMPFIAGAKLIDESVILGIGYLSAAILALTAADLINGISSLLGCSLADLGTDLSIFMTNASGFLTGIKSLDPSAAEGAKNLAAAILALTVADVVNGVRSFISGDNSLAEFAKQIVPFGEAMVAFSEKVTGKIDEGDVTAAANAGKAIAEMQKELYGAGGIKQWIFGEKDMRTFGAQLVGFGSAIVSFSEKVKGKVDEGDVTAAANAGKAIAGLQNELYGAGGLKQGIFGEKDLTKFSGQLVAFGSAIVSFSEKVKGKVDEGSVTAAANAGKTIAGLQSELNGVGGIKQKLFGEKDLTNFGAQLVAFGSAITGFSAKVDGNISDEAVQAAARAGEMMVTLQNNIPEEGWFDGKVNLEDFGSTIVKYGEKLVEYGDEVGFMDTNAVSDSLTATLTLVNIAKALQGINSATAILNLAPITDIGIKLKDFGTKMAEVDLTKLGSAVDIASRLKGLVTGLSSIDTRGVDRFKSAIEKLSQTNLSDLITAFEGSADKLANVGSDIVKFLCDGMTEQQGNFNSTANKIISGLSTAITNRESVFFDSGKLLINKFSKALGDGREETKDAMTGLLTACLATVRNKVASFTSAGRNLVEGFANGISANTYKAVAQAMAMANAAEQAAKEALGINSPSKVFYKIGDFTGQGFINALAGYASKAYRSATEMGDSAKSGLNDALSKAYDIINGDLETQPTIRPVLDLSSVEAGASRMNGLLNGVSNVGVMTNMNAIGSMMEQRRQNGSNADVVSAIDRLRKGLDSTGGTTNYNINGISYDDGSNIANAVETIARAALRERRT